MMAIRVADPLRDAALAGISARQMAFNLAGIAAVKIEADRRAFSS